MLKKKHYEIEFWTGIRNKVPVCCIMFYHSAWLPSIQNKIAEYKEKMASLTDNEGVILCPECITYKMTEKIKTNPQKNCKHLVTIRYQRGSKVGSV